MDFTYTEEQLAVKEAAREFAHSELLPGVIERDNNQQFLPLDQSTHPITCTTQERQADCRLDRA